MTDEFADALANCPSCLHPLVPAGDDERPWWSCTHCGWAGIAA